MIAPHSNKGRPWSEAETAYIRANMHLTDTEMSATLAHRQRAFNDRSVKFA